MPKRVLAVGHDGYRAGAQIVFLHILRWLRSHTELDLSLLLRSGGALVEDYEAVLPTSVLSSPGATRTSRLLTLPDRVLRRPTTPAGWPRAGTVDLVYANSAASAHLAVELGAHLGCPAVCHVHELEMSIRRFAGRFRDATKELDGYVAVSRAVERNLVETYGVPPEAVHLVHEAVPLPAPVAADERARRRAELGVPDDAFVVGGSGTADWRKAPDVFLLVAKAVRAAAPSRPIRFIWVGGEPAQLELVHHDLARLGLADLVTILDQRPDPMATFVAFDAFLLTSREDPFPLVCLEAAALGLPVLCYADAGGMPEFVEDDAGYVLPYLDVDATAEALLALAASEPTRAALGQRAKEKVAERCSIDVVGPQIASVLHEYL